MCFFLTEHLRHGPPQLPQGEAPSPPASVPHPGNEHRYRPGGAGRHVPPPPLEEEQAEGIQTWSRGTLSQNHLSTEEKEVHGRRLGLHQRRGQTGDQQK